MKKAIIKMKDLWKTYHMGETTLDALKEINLEIYQGEFFTILGHSGSGKSTMLNMVGSLDLPTKGKIFLDGIDISTLHESDLAQLRGKKIGLVFQSFNLIPSLTALENVSLPMIFQGQDKNTRDSKSKELLSLVGLSSRMTHKASQLSGGEKQRVAIARALSNNPEVILADEPTGNLDSKTGAEIMNIFEDLHKNHNRTIIMVTHDIGLVKGSDRSCYLSDGKIIKVSKNIKEIKEMVIKK
nr:ABC transporter ATP-binding protein [Candidatus Woesearchaeota archaeon]